jgi:signal transduction histidine kinase/ActR/RegA family two-component response regulator
VSFPLRYQVAAALVGLNVAGTAALATFAYRASRESLEHQAELAVDVAARAREESLVRLLEGRRDRITAFLGSVESLCGERGPGGRFGWERECVRVALSGFQTAERAGAVELWYRARPLAARGIDAEGANRSKDEFLAMLSHELRTPLTAILGWSSIMSSRGGDHPLAQEGLDAIVKAARTQARLVDELLDVSRIVSGKLRLTLADGVSVAGVVDSALAAARPPAEAKRIEITRTIEATPYWITADAGRLQQVMSNLLSNAVRFTPAGGHIDVAVAGAEDGVEMRVADNGIGIAPDFLPHVFERFRQADSSTTRAYGGLGLGLAIARHLVELHGGTIRVASGGPGCGATFVVCLPRRTVADASQRLEPVHGRLIPPLLEGTRILVVDDDPETRRFVRTILEDAGAMVATTSSADQTRAVLRCAQPDVLIADIGLPREDGCSLMRSVRALAPGKSAGVPAIALSARVRPEDVEEAIASGFHMHLSKPIDPSTLLSAVAATLLHHEHAD